MPSLVGSEMCIRDRIRSLAVHGKGETKYDNVRIGMNSRLDAMQAAILQIKLKAFKEYEVVEVNERAKWYDEMLAETDLRLPRVPNDFISSWAQYTVMLPDRLNLSLIHISEPTRLGMISYAVFCLKKKTRHDLVCRLLLEKKKARKKKKKEER